MIDGRSYRSVVGAFFCSGAGMICREVSINMPFLCYHGSKQGNGDMGENGYRYMGPMEGSRWFSYVSCILLSLSLVYRGVERENKVCGFPSL